MELQNTTIAALATIYPREATILAATCAIIFSVVGVIGMYFIYLQYIL